MLSIPLVSGLQREASSPRRAFAANLPATRKRPAPAPRYAITRSSADHRMIAKAETFLASMHMAGRRAVSIVDANCGNGAALIAIAACARKLGFMAVDATGLDRSAACVAAAHAAETSCDPAIRFTFALARDGARLPLADEEFDLTLLPREADRALVRDLERVTCRGGVLIPRL